MMMSIQEFGLFELATVISSATAVVLGLAFYRHRARLRTRELKAAADALRAHYEAVSVIADDPALPLDALEMIAEFTESLANQDFCEQFADHLLKAKGSKRGRTPKWFAEVEALRATRPDLVENFHKAVASGLVALFLRWPENAPKFERMVAEVAADGRREAILAQRVSEIRRRPHRDDHHHHGGLVAA